MCGNNNSWVGGGLSHPGGGKYVDAMQRHQQPYTVTLPRHDNVQNTNPLTVLFRAQANGIYCHVKHLMGKQEKIRKRKRKKRRTPLWCAIRVVFFSVSWAVGAGLTQALYAAKGLSKKRIRRGGMP